MPDYPQPYRSIPGSGSKYCSLPEEGGQMRLLNDPLYPEFRIRQRTVRIPPGLRIRLPADLPRSVPHLFQTAFPAHRSDLMGPLLPCPARRPDLLPPLLPWFLQVPSFPGFQTGFPL